MPATTTAVDLEQGGGGEEGDMHATTCKLLMNSIKKKYQIFNLIYILKIYIITYPAAADVQEIQESLPRSVWQFRCQLYIQLNPVGDSQ